MEKKQPERRNVSTGEATETQNKEGGTPKFVRARQRAARGRRTVKPLLAQVGGDGIGERDREGDDACALFVGESVAGDAIEDSVDESAQGVLEVKVGLETRLIVFI